MSSVMATDNRTGTPATLYLSSYLTGLDSSNCTKTGCTYTFALDGTVLQTTP
jgi:hypothetical protein